MHRLLLAPEKEKKTDHKNGNTLDNRRLNLRASDKYESNRNVGRTVRNTSGFRGVSETKIGRFRAYIRNGGKNVYLGTYDTAREAHAAYCTAAKRFHGEFANFG